MSPRPSGSFDEFANSLASEALSEAADNFFGRRVELEREAELIQRKAKELQRQAEQALDASALLGALLLDDDEADAFFRALNAGLEDGFVSSWRCSLRNRPLRLKQSPSMALTKAGRFAKLLDAAYQQTRQAFDEYRHGRITQDTPRGPKRMSLHYQQMQDWCDEHNCRVRDANAAQSPSCVIGFCKQLVGDGDRERIMGGGSHGGCSLDDSLSMKPVQFSALDLPRLPALPQEADTAAAIKTFAQSLFSRRGQELTAVMERLQRQ